MNERTVRIVAVSGAAALAVFVVYEVFGPSGTTSDDGAFQPTVAQSLATSVKVGGALGVGGLVAALLVALF